MPRCLEASRSSGRHSGGHEIATIQSTAIDRDSGTIKLTTTLAHALGCMESALHFLPVCALAEYAGAASDGGGADPRAALWVVHAGRNCRLRLNQLASCGPVTGPSADNPALPP